MTRLGSPNRRSARRTALTVLASLLAACGSGATGPDDRQPTDEGPAASGTQLLSSGEFVVPAARAFSDEGFHKAIEIDATLPADLGPTRGGRLVFSLRDVTRPDMTCDAPHPTSGCVTVDWSDAPGRPGTPDDGVFVNRIRLQTRNGTFETFLSETDGLSDEPDDFAPG